MQKIEKDPTEILYRKQVVSFKWENEDFHVYWEGLVFINGILSGKESIERFMRELKTKSIKDACSLLKGIYFISVKDKTSGDICAFVDNSGLYQAFYTKKSISTSFLELVKNENCQVHHLDQEAIVEFLYFGTLFFNKTFFKSISRIPRDKILHLRRQGGKINMLQKNIPAINEPFENASKSIQDIFGGIAHSLSNLNISIDLTGGTDTRLIALILDYYGLKFETAVSGGAETYPDVFISEKVAKAISHPWYSTIHTINALEKEIPELFNATEGLYNILSIHRLLQLQKDRLTRGIDTIISGVGGEFFKDFWWLQDFPLYSSRSANIKRFVDMRIMSFKPMQFIFSDKVVEASQTLRKNIIQKLLPYRLETNTKTYDNIGFNFTMREVAGRELANYSSYLKTYAPLLDLDIVRIGFNLPRNQRIFNAYLRKELTILNPLIAKIPTTEGGISVSSEPLMIIQDLPKYAIEKIDRILIKLNLKKRKRFNELNCPNFYHHVRKMEIMRKSLSILKDVEIINHKIELENFEDRLLGMILSLGMLVNYLNNKEKST